MYKISADCTGCGACVGICPSGAIHPQGDLFMIGPECTDCGACEPECPVDAISEDNA